MYPNMSDAGRDDIYVPYSSQLTSLFTSTSISMPTSLYPNLSDPTSTTTVAVANHRALIASQNHREAEKRRRERIKSHLDRLRAILACDPKIDKASLLAKAVEIMRDLKQRIADITTSDQLYLIPTETDEVVVLPSTSSSDAGASSSRRIAVFDASISCDDRSDLLPDLIATLRSVRVKTLRAEIATMGGRIRHKLVLARENNDEEEEEEEKDAVTGGEFLMDALKSLVDQAVPVERSKKRRVTEMS